MFFYVMKQSCGILISLASFVYKHSGNSLPATYSAQPAKLTTSPIKHVLTTISIQSLIVHPIFFINMSLSNKLAVGIQELPNEVIHHICGFLGQPELLAISLTCKHIHLLAEPNVYAHFQVSLNYFCSLNSCKDPLLCFSNCGRKLQQTEGAATPLLLRAVLEKPHLGQHIKSLEIECYDYGENEEYKDSQHNSKYLTETYRNETQKHLQDYFSGYNQGPKSILTSATWSTDIKESSFNQDYLNASLILLLPRLESILFSGYYQNSPYLLDIFSRASHIQLGGNPTETYSLSKLRELLFNSGSIPPLTRG